VDELSQLENLNLDFSFSALMAGFIFGVIGFYLFRHGKKRVHYPWILIGLVLMIYPLFVSGDLMNWGIGLVLCGAAYFMRGESLG
jgi:hypothetical protein